MTYGQLYRRAPAPLRIVILFIAGLHGIARDARNARQLRRTD